jgi:hypothetical protein
MEHTHTGILFSHEKEQNDVCRKTDRTGDYHVM